MFRGRLIPCLLLRGAGLVKTRRFADPKYVGDPINAVRIFNEKEVDELVVLDISATVEKREPAFDLIADIAGECFMPMAYGGGVRSLADMERLFTLGVEKVVINHAALERPQLIEEAARRFGSQSIVVSVDVKRTLFGKYRIHTKGGTTAMPVELLAWVQQAQDRGAGELLLNSIDRDGTGQGYDLEVIRAVTSRVTIPVIACGGAGSLRDCAAAIREGGASAAAAGSIFVFHGRHRAVLISYPPQEEIAAAIQA